MNNSVTCNLFFWARVPRNSELLLAKAIEEKSDISKHSMMTQSGYVNAQSEPGVADGFSLHFSDSEITRTKSPF